jgi:hypothetical protein
MAADALQLKPLKPRLLSVSPSEVYSLKGKCDISFDLPQSRPLVLAAAGGCRKLGCSANLDEARERRTAQAERAPGGLPPQAWSLASAASTTASGVIPKCLKTAL